MEQLASDKNLQASEKHSNSSGIARAQQHRQDMLNVAFPASWPSSSDRPIGWRLFHVQPGQAATPPNMPPRAERAPLPREIETQLARGQKYSQHDDPFRRELRRFWVHRLSGFRSA